MLKRQVEFDSIKMSQSLYCFTTKDKDGIVRFNVRSTNPLFEVTSITGSTFYKPEKNIGKSGVGLGIQCGIGFGGDLKPAPYIGVGIQYSLITF